MTEDAKRAKEYNPQEEQEGPGAHTCFLFLLALLMWYLLGIGTGWLIWG